MTSKPIAPKTGKLVWDVFIVMENEKADLNECKKILKRGAVQCEPSDILLIMDGGWCLFAVNVGDCH